MKRIKYFIATVAIIFANGLVLAPAIAHADFKGDACSGLADIGGSCSSSSSSIDNLLTWVLNILSVVVGFVAVVMVIVGGLKFITSNGDSSNTASARNTIIYALIGLVIVALAQVLVHFVLSKTGGAIK